MSTVSPLLRLNNDVSMPALGLGVYQTSPAETEAAVQSALDYGYRLIDTAAAYSNEREVGRAIANSEIDRSEIFVTTKLWISDFGYDQALRAFDKSQAKLGLDHIDLYLLHFPVPSDFENTIGAYKAAEKLLSDGRVRAIGVSNFEPAHLHRLMREAHVVPAVNQVELHPYYQQSAVRKEGEALGIVTQAWSPLGGANIYDAPDPSKARFLLRETVLQDIADAHQKSTAQVVLRWHMQHGISVIPKSVKSERIRENAAVFDFALTTDQMQAIDALESGLRGGPDPDDVDNQMFPFTVGD